MQHQDGSAQTAFIGFGEASSAFVAGWGVARPATIRAYDIKTETAPSRDAMYARYKDHQVDGAETVQEALAGSAMVFSLVTADQSLAAAEAAAAHIEAGTLWLDCNSCAPDTKGKAADAIEAAGGHYVDVAVMAPVHPQRHLVPLLVSGPHAAAAAAALRLLGMRPEIAGPSVGQASSIKMLRSVMIKGLEALTAECFLAARRAGVEAPVLASLEASDPDIDWLARSSRNLERMVLHGTRRAAEMHEVAATVAGLGLNAGMSSATAGWQDRIGGLGVDAGEDRLIERLDRILAAL